MIIFKIVTKMYVSSTLCFLVDYLNIHLNKTLLAIFITLAALNVPCFSRGERDQDNFPFLESNVSACVWQTTGASAWGIQGGQFDRGFLWKYKIKVFYSLCASSLTTESKMISLRT